MQSSTGRLNVKRLRATTALVTSLSLVFASDAAHALPAGGQVNGGAADITSTTSQMIVNQSTGRALIDWNSFNIGSGEAVQFNQPNSTSIALNRVRSGQASTIDGSLTANGQVWLVNPQGVMFGNGAQVNVGGLLATTSDINNADFMAGNYQFNTPGNPNGLISNAGHIKIADGGVAALVGTNVTNSGLIEARLGKVQLASGDTFSVDLFGDGLINLQASPAITSQLVQNSGVITAAGGKVLMTTAAAQNTVNSLINMSGLIVANRVGEHNGVVTLYAEGSNAVKNNVAADKGQKSGSSNVLVSGVIDASAYASLNPATGGVGGNVSILGDSVAILSGSIIDASGDTGGGYIKIGGDFHGAGTTPTALNTYVDGGALIMASAVTNGNGGNVAVWSDGQTDFFGTIFARGGAQSGNGGFVETSGHDLRAMGLVNAGATHGNGGLWLLDPNNIVISQASCTGTSCSNANTIGASLTSGSDVTVTTTDGSITLNNSTTITDSGSTTQTLTFNAGTDIIMNSGSAITASGSARLNVIFDSNTALGGGAISISGGITSNGGNITLGGGGGAITGATMNADGTVNTAATGFAVGDAACNLGVFVNSTINAGGGNIIINGSGYTGNSGIMIANTIQTSGTGTINISGTGGAGGANGNTWGIYIYGGDMQVVNGNLTLVGIGGNTTGNGNAGIRVDSPAIVETKGTGTLYFNGTGTSTGTGQSGVGVNLNSITRSTAVGGGNIFIVGTGGAGTINNNSGFSGGGVTSVDGNINVTAITHSGVISFFTGTNGFQTTGTGNIAISTDFVQLAGANSIISANNLTIAPTTASTTVGVAGGAGNLNLSTTYLGYVTYGSLTIGNTADTGAMAVNAYTWGNNLSLISGAGAITIAGAQALGANAFTMETNVTPTMTSTVTTTGLLTVETSGSTTLGVGTHATGTVNLSDTALGNLTGGSYQFGSTITGALDINTASTGITSKNLSFISGGTIYLDKSGDTSPQTLTKSSGGATSLTLQAGTDIVQNGNMSASGAGNAWNITFDSNYALGGGAITLCNGCSMTSNNGNITMGGGNGAITGEVLNADGTVNTAAVGFAVGDAYQAVGISMVNSPIAAGTGNIVMNGQGYSTTTNNNYGVQSNGGSNISTTSGNISITGIGGGSGGSSTNYGVDTVKLATTSGTVYLIGTGGVGGNNYGVHWHGGGIATTGASTVIINGTKGSGGGSGLIIDNSSNPISAASTGTITILTSGGAQFNGATASVVNGALSVTDTTSGIQLYNGASLASSGSGNITLNARTSNITTNSAGTNVIGGASDSGNITLIGDTTPTGTNLSIRTTGTVTIMPYSASTTIGIAGGAGSLGLTATYLGYVSAGSIVIGNSADTAAMTIGAYTWGAPVTLNNGSGKIEIAGIQTLGTNSLTAVTSSGNIQIDQGDKIVSTASSGNSIVLASGGNFVNNDSNDGSSALSPGSGTARYLVYSADPSLNTLSGLSDAGKHVFNKTYAGYAPGSVTQTGNLFLYSLAPTITVTANDASRLYGAADPSFTASYSGFVDGDTSSILSGSPSFSTPGGDTATSAAGSTYTITAALNTLANSIGYGLTTANGTLTVNKAHLTVTANDASRLYGAADPAFTDSFSGFVNGQNSSVVSGSATNTTPGTDTATSAASSTYAITPTLGTLSASNYDFTVFNAGTLTVNKAHLSVTANDASRLYGASDPAFTDSFTGFVNGQNSSVVSGSATNSTPGGDTATSAAGSTYAITPTLGTLSASNYDFTVFNAGTLTINPALLTVTATAGQNKIYGAADPGSFAYTYTGLVNGESAASFTGALNRVAGENVGTYAINQNTLAATGNYTIGTYNSHTFAITPASLAITANNQTQTYGFGGTSASLGTSGFTSVGLQNGETVGAVTLSTNASRSSSGNYKADTANGNNPWTLTPSAATGGTFSAGNYSITYNNASTGLTINTKALSITGLSGTDKVYDGLTSDSTTGTASVSGKVAGDTVNLANGTASFANPNVGGGKTITFTGFSVSGADAGNYSLSQPANSTANIAARGLTITASNESKTYGSTFSFAGTEFTPTGLQNGETIGSVTLGSAGAGAGASVAGGPYSITISGATGGTFSAGNYSISYVNGSMAINSALLTVTATAGQNKPSGAADPVSFAYTYSGLVNGDPSANFTGSLNRVAGESIGTYAINLNTLAATGNYSIGTYNSALFTIGQSLIPADLVADASQQVSFLQDVVDGLPQGLPSMNRPGLSLNDDLFSLGNMSPSTDSDKDSAAPSAETPNSESKKAGGCIGKPTGHSSSHCFDLASTQPR